MRGGFPLFDDDKRIVAKRRQRAKTLSVQESCIFDATLLSMHRGHIRLERLEHGLALACFCHDFHDYLDHLFVLVSYDGSSFKTSVSPSARAIADRSRCAL